ncbi:hypothetical protein [Hanstruepera ponticola]|uniref:hypothetical protein n=1 Tax=Hanstruepera ponticola TaxID=2042995 RepID=UPI000CF0DFEF|nr:hypothetical protein [Hanstruepera ponticola]
MKLFFLFIFFTITVNYGLAQDITLRVLGYSSYTEYAESNVALISTNDSSLVKINKLKDSISAYRINSELIEINSLKNQNSSHFKIEHADINEFDKLLVLCSALEISVNKVYFKMPEHIFEEEDQKAVLALNNANSKAKLIANHLGYKIDNILNIDDDTTYASSIYDAVDFDSERVEVVLRLLELLGSGNSQYETESSKPIRSGGYNLWVTYNLKKK